MNLSPIRLFLLIGFVLLLSNATSGEPNENHSSDKHDEEEEKIKKSDEKLLKKDEPAQEKETPDKQNIEEEGSNETVPSNDDAEPSMETNNEAFKEISSVFLSKLDEDLQKKVESKMGEANFSLNPEFFDGFADDEKEKLHKALADVFAPLFSEILQQMSGLSSDIFKIKESAMFNFSTETTDENESMEKDEL